MPRTRARRTPARPRATLSFVRRGRAGRRRRASRRPAPCVRQVEVVGDRRAVGHRPEAGLLLKACAGCRPEEDSATSTARAAAHDAAGYPSPYDRAMADGPPDRRLRLRCRRPDRPPRVPGDDAERGLRLPRRPRAAAVRPAPARRGAPLRARDRRRTSSAQGVKLIVVACNTATSVALPDLQEQLAVPVVGVIAPEAHAAVQATRNRRIGLLATGDRRERAATSRSCTRSTPACASRRSPARSSCR